MAKKQAPVPSDIMGPPEDGSEKDYEANNAYRTMVEADAHRANPAMMKRVGKVAERHMGTAKKVMKSVQDIKDYRKAKYPAKLQFEKKPS